jgi:hypothetical protein
MEGPNRPGQSRSTKPGAVVRGPLLPEPAEVLVVLPMGPMGDSCKLIARGLTTGQAHDVILSPDQLAQLTVSAETEPFDGDASLFRLDIEAHRLGSPTNTTPTSLSPSPGSTRCTTSSEGRTSAACRGSRGPLQGDEAVPRRGRHRSRSSALEAGPGSRGTCGLPPRAAHISTVRLGLEMNSQRLSTPD